MSIYRWKETKVPPTSEQAVSPEIRNLLTGMLKKDKVSVDQIRAAVESGGTTPATTAEKAGTKLIPEVQWPVVILYLVIVIVLGVALMYSLSLGTAFVQFSSSIITAITTIAGFAVGANVTPKT